METKKILVLTSTFPRWESDTEPDFVFELSRNLVHKGYLIDVIAPHADGAKEHEEMEGVHVYRYRYFFKRFQTLAYQGGIPANLRSNKFNYLLIPFFFFFQFIAIVIRLKKEKYDLIHAHWLIPQALMAVLAVKIISDYKVPILCTAHGADIYSLSGKFLKLIKIWVAKNCNHICVVSKAMKSHTKKLKIKDKNISVLSMGVDLESLFIPTSKVKRIENNLIFVGRFVDKKGIPVLIDALSKVVSIIPSVKLLLVGGGPLYKNITELVESKGLNDNVIFHGCEMNKKIPELYASASIAVVPSIIDQHGDTEGLGLVTIEGMGCECAVVASALEPIKEVVQHDVSGLLFQPGDSEQLAKCLIELLQNKEKRNSIAKEGRVRAKEKYDWQSITRKHCDLIESFF